MSLSMRETSKSLKVKKVAQAEMPFVASSSYGNTRFETQKGLYLDFVFEITRYPIFLDFLYNFFRNLHAEYYSVPKFFSKP